MIVIIIGTIIMIVVVNNVVVGIDTNIEVIVALITTWEAHPIRGRSPMPVVSFVGH